MSILIKPCTTQFVQRSVSTRWTVQRVVCFPLPPVGVEVEVNWGLGHRTLAVIVESLFFGRTLYKRTSNSLCRDVDSHCFLYFGQ